MIHGDLLPYPIAFATFDAAVNSGTGQAIKWLQVSLGVTADGVMGPQTIASATKQTDIGDIVVSCCRRRILMLSHLPNFNIFGNGWVQRILTVLRIAVTD